MKLKCPHCKYSWEYKGNLEWVTCPNCMNKFKREKK